MKSFGKYAIVLLVVICCVCTTFSLSGCGEETEAKFDLTAGINEVEVLGSHESVTVNGTASIATLSLNVGAGDKPVYIYLNSVTATSIDGASIISSSSSREIHLVLNGQNTLTAVHAVGINCPAGSLFIEGNGSLTVKGGSGSAGAEGSNDSYDGMNGTQGSEAIIALSISVDIANSVTLVGDGGRGGNGAHGSRGQDGEWRGWSWENMSPGNSDHGKPGGNAGNGGDGGKGGDSIRTTMLTIQAGNVYLIGGKGGDAGNGGKGGDGGKGGINDWGTSKGGRPGSGGNGGNGGDASYGGNATLESQTTISKGVAGNVTISVGESGLAGLGGRGGSKGGPSGDQNGDINTNACDGVAGSDGTAIA